MPQRVICSTTSLAWAAGTATMPIWIALLADGVREVLHGLDYEAADALPDLALVGVKGGYYLEALWGEAGVADDGAAETAHAYYGHVPLVVQLEDVL